MSRPKPVETSEEGGNHPQTSLRRMEGKDVDAVMVIELKAYEFPWTEGIFRDCMRVGYCCRVLEKAGEMIGYAVMSLGAGETHVLNLCVRPDERGQGHGYTLLNDLIEQAHHWGAEMMFLEVRPSNTAARALYNRLNFNEVGLRAGYYPARIGREDALILARHL